MKLLSQSRLSAARRCQRFHDIRYLLRYRTVEEAAPLYFGDLIHHALESIWLGQPVVLPAEADPFDLARARPMIAGYLARWDVEAYDVIAVEKEFECDLVNPATGAKSKTWRLAGKVDVIVRERATGRLLVIEHKTSSQDVSPGSTYWARLSMDSQLSIYFVGTTSLGYKVDALLYDVLVKPQLRPGAIPIIDGEGFKIVLDGAGERVRTKDGKKWRETGSAADSFVLQTRPETPEEYEVRVTLAIAAAPDQFYARGEVVRLEAEIADAMVDVWQSAQQIHEAERLHRSPRNPDACEHWGRLCDFFPVCSGAETLSNERLYRLSTTTNPELSGTAAGALPAPAKEEQHGNANSEAAVATAAAAEAADVVPTTTT